MYNKDNFTPDDAKKNTQIKREILNAIENDAVVRITERAQREALEQLNCTKQDIIDITKEYINDDNVINSFPAIEEKFKGKEQHLIEPDIPDVGTSYIKYQFGHTAAKKKNTITIVSAHLK